MHLHNVIASMAVTNSNALISAFACRLHTSRAYQCNGMYIVQIRIPELILYSMPTQNKEIEKNNSLLCWPTDDDNKFINSGRAGQVQSVCHQLGHANCMCCIAGPPNLVGLFSDSGD
jgi:hypothetical protein